jgi:hypothetical protein
MPRIPEISRRQVGLTVGELGNSLQPVKDQLDEFGILFRDRTTIWRMRRELPNRGQSLLLQLMGERLMNDESWTTPNMHKQIRTILQTATQLSNERTSWGMLRSDGLTENIATTCGYKPQEMRRILRAIRANVVLLAQSNAHIAPIMQRSVAWYLDDQEHLPPSRRKIPLDDFRDHQTFPDFYHALYGDTAQTPTGRRVGGFLPYEIRAWSEIWESLEDTPLPLTRVIMTQYARLPNPHLRSIASHVRVQTGVPVDGSVLAAELSLTSLDFPS